VGSKKDNIFSVSKYILTAKNQNFIWVNYNVWLKWKIIIKFLLIFNKNFTTCEIYKKKHRSYKNIVILGLKWRGKNVKGRTIGYAKKFIQRHKDAKCLYCNIVLTNDNATSDHIVPVSKKGTNSKVNLIVCCVNCNVERGNIPFMQYLTSKNPDYKNEKYVFI